jgi:type II secretory ATPase GspE/PulE/Tfp pilus assembly ATPase PilB-like protein
MSKEILLDPAPAPVVFKRRASDLLIEAVRQQHVSDTKLSLHSSFEDEAEKSAHLVEVMRNVLARFEVKKPRIDEIIDRWMLTREELTSIATDIGVINYEQALEASSIINSIPLAPESHSINPTNDVINLVAKNKEIKMGVFNGYVPLAIINDANEKKLIVAISKPEKLHVASSHIRMPIKPMLMSEFDIVRIYRQNFSNVRKELNEALAAATKQGNDESAARQILMLIVKFGTYNNASDIHLYKSIARLGLVQVTIDGVSFLLKTLPEWLFDAILNILILDNEKTTDIQSMHCPGTIIFHESDKSIIGHEVINSFNFRLQIGNTSNGLNSRGKTAVIRLLAKNSQNVSLTKLGYAEKSVFDLTEIIESSAGLFLVVGPTGSGKSTTLYSLMNKIDPIERSVLTIENPVEFEHGAWKQYTLLQNEGDKDEAISYAEIAKSSLRQAPKVILVGEIRDLKVAQIASQAANTGHLVLATLHANDASSGIYRMINMGVDKEELALILKGVLAQRLVRLLCNACKVPDKDNHHHVLEHLHGDHHGDCNVFKAAIDGCEMCNHTGYAGRKVVHELIIADEEIKELIASGANAIEIEKRALKGKGRSTMVMEAYRLIADGETSVSEVRRAVL